jgi:hypothetical protein
MARNAYSQSPPQAQPSFRQRKSSTIVPIASSSDSSISSAPAKPTSSAVAEADQDQIHSLRNMHSQFSFQSQISLPPSFRTVEPSSPTLSDSSMPCTPRTLGAPGPASRRASEVSSIVAIQDDNDDESTPLLGGGEEVKWYQGPLFMAGIKFVVLFVAFTALVAGTFWFGIPKLDQKDREVIKLPRNFADLQALKCVF